MAYHWLSDYVRGRECDLWGREYGGYADCRTRRCRDRRRGNVYWVSFEPVHRDCCRESSIFCYDCLADEKHNRALTYLAVFTSLRERPIYNALIGLSWGTGAILGPVIAGAFSGSKATWRWAFYINLPLAAREFFTFSCSAMLSVEIENMLN